MQSILSCEFVPSDEIIPPEDPSLLDLRGTVTNLSLLRGGFISAHALFGYTDSADSLARSRQAPAQVLFPYGRVQAPTRFTCFGDSNFATLHVQADIQEGIVDVDELRSDSIDQLHEVASRLACASMLFRDVLPRSSHRATFSDAAGLAVYKLTLRNSEF